MPRLFPALIGETERTAQLRLSQDGLALSAVSEIRSPAYPSDVVVAQDPRATRRAASAVTLLVNRGDRGVNYVMPDLIGVNGDRAAEILRGHGFRVAVVGTTPYPGVAAGIVVRQSPQAGFQIAPGRANLTRGEPVSVQIAPSILSADFASLGKAIESRSNAAARTSFTWT